MIQALSQDYPKQMICGLLGCPRSTFYYEPVVNAEDAQVVEAIEGILMHWPFYGYRRVTRQLQREDWNIGETRVRRLLREIDHSCRVGKIRIRTTNSQHNLPRYPNRIKGLNIMEANQIWVADITYIRLGRRFIYLAIILDACTRGLRGWNLGRSLEKSLTMEALKMALARHPAPQIHHSDQGVQYAAIDYIDLLDDAKVQVSMSNLGQPTENALAERFMRTLKEEHVDYTEYADFDDALRQLANWLEVEYMTERIHSALDYLTPAEFEAALVDSQADPLLMYA